MRDIGKNIRDLRIQNGMSQEELAGRLYVTRQTISNYETGNSRPDIDIILKLTELLHTDTNTILYGLPVAEDKKTLIRRNIVISVIFAVLVTIRLFLSPLNSNWKRGHIFEYNYFLTMFYDPFMYMMAGWWIMNIVGLVTKVKSSSKCCVGKLKKVVIILLIVYVLFDIPIVVFELMELSNSAANQFRAVPVNLSFPVIPVYNKVWMAFIYINFKFPLVYPIIGAVLWIIGFPGKKLIKKGE